MENVLDSIKYSNEIIISELTQDNFGNFVLWAIVKKENKTEIKCFVLEMVLDSWGYLEIPVSAHPFYYCCPVKFLYLCPENENSLDREKEWRYINKRSSKY